VRFFSLSIFVLLENGEGGEAGWGCSADPLPVRILIFVKIYFGKAIYLYP